MVDRVLSGRYRIVRHIARGGMAEVYLAHDQLLDRQVAVKVLFPELADDASFVERFRREARAAAGLNHHNIVSVFDFGEDAGSWFIVMEYVEGRTLRDIIRSDGPLAPTYAVEIAADVAAALDAAHRQGIIHRDVKPGNVLVSGVVKVADFGIARAGDPRDSLTQTGAVMGTATYLSPEQSQGQALDPRTDVYSLGVVLYEMLAGRPPFAGPNPVTVAYKHLSEVPVPPSQHNDQISPALDAVVLKALAKDPAQRHASADDLRSELLAVGRGGADPEPTVVAAPTTAVPAGDATETAMMASSLPATPPPVETTAVAGRPSTATLRRRQLTALGLLVLLVLGAILLVALLRSGESGTAGVPLVQGDLLEDAERKVRDAELVPVVDRRADRTGDPNRVLEQTPPAGTNARKGTTVTLVLPGAATTTTPTTRSPATTRAPATTAPVPTTTDAPTTTQATTPPTTAAPPTTSPPTTT